MYARATNNICSFCMDTGSRERGKCVPCDRKRRGGVRLSQIGLAVACSGALFQASVCIDSFFCRPLHRRTEIRRKRNRSQTPKNAITMKRFFYIPQSPLSLRSRRCRKSRSRIVRSRCSGQRRLHLDAMAVERSLFNAFPGESDIRPVT